MKPSKINDYQRFLNLDIDAKDKTFMNIQIPVIRRMSGNRYQSFQGISWYVAFKYLPLLSASLKSAYDVIRLWYWITWDGGNGYLSDGMMKT